MADKDYLENWRELYSYPNYITSNEYLTEDGSQSLDREEDWAYSQTQVLLKGNAIGTSKNNFLDPIPLFNKLGHIYTNIVNSAFVSARTDAIKVGIRNMDFTNGRTLEDLSPETVKVYEFFNFYGYTEMTLENIYNRSTTQANTNGNAIATLLNRIDKLSTTKDDNEGFSRCCVIDEDFLNSTLRLKQEEKVTVVEDLNRYTDWFENYIDKELFYKVLSEYNSKKPAWEQFWIKIDYVYTVDGIEYTQHYYAPSLQYVISWIKHCEALNGTQKGLQLLMPQYKRRVEVEDLDKNFWVISQILDAVVNALWGPYGLIDVVRQLVLKVLQIEDFLGLDNLTGIELLHSGSNDMYFDMYSRFTLSGLELKLKTSNGERIIKNFIKPHAETSDRDQTTDVYKTREDLFYGIQTNEVISVEDGMESTGIYDSDFISSDTTVDVNGKIGYTSLSTVIDAINNAIVGDKVTFGSYHYSYSPGTKEFFSTLDITPDGTLNPTDLKIFAEDKLISSGDTLTAKQIQRVANYKKAYEFLKKNFGEKYDNLYEILGIEKLEDIDKLFKKESVLVNAKLKDLDTNNDGNIEQELLEHYNEQLKQIRQQISSILNLYSGETQIAEDLSNLGESPISIGLKETPSTEENKIITQDRYDEMIRTITNLVKITADIQNHSYTQSSSNKKFLKIVTINYTADPLWPTTKTGDNLPGLPRLIRDNEALKSAGIFSEDFSISNYTPGIKFSLVSSETRKNKDIFFSEIKTAREDDKMEDNEAQSNVESIIENWLEGIDYQEYFIYIGDVDTIGVLPTEDVYVHSFTAAEILARYLVQESDGTGELVESFSENMTAVQKVFNVTEYLEYMESNNPFYTDAAPNVSDCAFIARQFQYKNDGYYNAYVKKLMENLTSSRDAYVAKFEGTTQGEFRGNFFDDIRRAIFPTTSYSSANNITLEDLFGLLFTKKQEKTDSYLVSNTIYTPSLYFLIALKKITGSNRVISGFEITNADRQALIGSISEHDYKLYGNILLFLYDEDYYEMKFNTNSADLEFEVTENNGTSRKIKEKDGLWVKATDGFYTTSQPLIKYSLFCQPQDNTFAIFVPRGDLINGEIIQLRLTQKNETKQMLDLDNLTKEGFETFKTTGSNLFLSLHNCFATIESQYNHRTTLFFDDIVPEKVYADGSTENRPFTKVDDWFTNGIECQYFRPKQEKQEENTMIAKYQYIRTDLKIRASMLAKNEPFNDNSFYYELLTSNTQNTTEIDDDFYSFSREQAYCAAQRHNLLFYSSPGFKEADMYIHSPLQLLQTPYTRNDDSIQSPSWTIPSEGYQRFCFDVMSQAGQNCDIKDIKNMLYKNSLIQKYKVPHCIEAIWGSRKVDDYVKKKKLQYIVIEREPGSRNNTYGPTSVGVSYGAGYLHGNEGITSLGEYMHSNKTVVTWYDKTGMKLSYTGTKGFPPADAQYGVIDLTGITTKFANAFLIRFYGGNPKAIATEIEGLDREFTFEDENNNDLARRPIFRMAYFFGIDETGKKEAGSTGSANQYS